MSKRDYIKHYSSPNEPSDAQAGDEWYNTATNKLYKRLIDNGTTTGWLELSQDRTVSSGASSAISTALAANPSAVKSIVTIAGTNSSNRISFSNIPLTYKNLQLTGNLATTGVSSNSYLCIDFYKSGSRLNLSWMWGMFYNYGAYSGSNSQNNNYAYFWSVGGYSTPALTSGSIQILFADYVNQIGSHGTMNFTHGYNNNGALLSNFAFANSLQTRQGFDRFDLYWTTTTGSDSGTQYWSTDTKLTLYGLI